MPDRPAAGTTRRSPAKKTAKKAAAASPPAADDGPHPGNEAPTGEDTGYGDLRPEDTGIPAGDRTRAQLAAAGVSWHDDDVTIEEALLALQARLPVVPRSQTARIPGKNGGQGYSYTYADLGDVWHALQPVLAAVDLVFVCTPRRTEAGQYELVGSLRHVPSGDSIDGALPLYGRASQELGSSITYARRYLLGCLTGLVTDDDDDSQAAARAGATTEEPQVTTPELLARLDAAAKSQGITVEQITAKWREGHGGLAPGLLPTLAPFTLLPLVESIEAYLSAQAAVAPPTEGDS